GVVLVDGLLGHGERAGQRDLDWLAGIGPQKLNNAHFDRPRATNGSDDAWDDVWAAAATESFAGPVEVDTVQRGREPVAVALAPDLTIAQNIDAGALHRGDRHQGRVVLGLLEELFRHPPDISGANARRQ